MAARSYLSIGEVLSSLQVEFSDVTISKIRFLESQGLIDPERTPSGYRKFYDTDVTRLRDILRLQREEFLPLKVIKDRLHEMEPTTEVKRAKRVPPRSTDAVPTLFVDTAAAVVAPVMSVTKDELAAAAGVPTTLLDELEKYGLLKGRPYAGTVYYDEEALVVSKLARSLQEFGVEARHLRVYKNAADREVSLFEQIVLPLLKQRSPQARDEAVATVAQLSALGQNLRAALVRRAIRDLTCP